MDEDKPGGTTARRLGVEVSIGAMLGFVGASLAGPAVIAWWYEPPSKDAFSCASSVRTALSQFVTMQLTCAAVGGVLLAALLFFSRRIIARRKAPSSPT
jgi:Mg/Co/Ni transporter MgtE